MGRVDKRNEDDQLKGEVVGPENYNWHKDGGRQIMDRIEREAFLPGYSSDMGEEEQAAFEMKYKRHKKDVEKKRRLVKKMSYHGVGPIKNPCGPKELFSLEILIQDG